MVAQLVKKKKKICLHCGRPGFNPWVGKIPWRRERLPTPVFGPGEFHGLYSPWGHKESDMTEQLSKIEKEMATHSSILAWRIPRDKGAWRATVHGVTKRWTQLSHETQHTTHIISYI